MRLDTKIRNKRVTIHNNGDVYVDGTYTNLRQWESNQKRWSNGSGQEQSDLKDKSLDEVPKIRGYIWYSEIWVYLYRKIWGIPLARFEALREPHFLCRLSY